MSKYLSASHLRRPPVEEDFSKVKSIYYLYLGGFLTFYISTLVGYMKAFPERKNPNNSTIMSSHYKYQVKIMHINMLINLVVLLGSMAYTFYIISGLDLMNLEIDDNLMKPFAAVISVSTFASVGSTILLYIQTMIGLKKIHNKQQI